MNPKRSLLARMLVLSAALVAVLLASAKINPNPVIPALPANCVQYQASNGGTGCTTGTGCPWWSPNVGLVWNEVYWCCYDSNGQLNNSGQPGPWCIWSVSGCCNNLDTTPHCPAPGSCPYTGP